MIVEDGIEQIKVTIASTFKGKTRCCGVTWVPVDVKLRARRWLLLAACPDCGDVHALPLDTGGACVLSVATDGTLLGSRSYLNTTFAPVSLRW